MRQLRKKLFAMCVENGGYQVSLEKKKVYEILPPEPKDPPSYCRVVDESGEGYLFPASWFVPLELPLKARRAMKAH